MRFEIVLAPQAVRELRALPARLRSEVRDALETHLRHEPTKVNKSRIKRLRGIAKPQYRLRVGETRVFYDVRDETVEVLAIVAKRQAQEWLAAQGTPEPDSGPGKGEG
jgi:mRNA-degrading endonuclease RelE of RelBE toxin-antitoxin system